MVERAFCLHCSAWRGSLGLEPTPDLYVQHLVEIFRDVKRVLRDDGTLWLNLGDTYSTTMFVHGYIRNVRRGSQWSTFGHYTWDGHTKGKRDIGNIKTAGRADPSWDIKPKDLCGIPWRVAFALQADGWWLRQDIIYSKANPMPESVRDRCTKSHEYIFLLSKSERYFYDAEAIKEQSTSIEEHLKRKRLVESHGNSEQSTVSMDGGHNVLGGMNGNRNRRSVWTIATRPYSGAHFATFPESLVTPCILAGTSERGACAACGAPWERITETHYKKHRPSAGVDIRSRNEDRLTQARGHGGWQGNNLLADVKTLGWRPTCSCNAPTVPCVVLDPFCGSGTVEAVAYKLARRGIGIDLSMAYLGMARQRARQTPMGLPL